MMDKKKPKTPTRPQTLEDSVFAIARDIATVYEEKYDLHCAEKPEEVIAEVFDKFLTDIGMAALDILEERGHPFLE